MRAQRPRDSTKRPNRVQVRLSDAELGVLRSRAEGEGLAVAAFLVRSALDGGVRSQGVGGVVLLQELMGIRRQLVLVVGGWVEPPPEAVLGRIEALLERWPS